ncbi:MAG: prepilin-type N-terminal cleavage/methylation domain-containing protein [Bacillota bacterium]
MITEQKGFTLLEVVLASSLFLLLLFALYGALDLSLKSYSRLEQNVDRQQNLRIALEAISQDLRKSHGLLAKASAVRIDQDNLLLESREGDVIWYYLNGNTLRWSIMLKGTKVFYAHNPVASGIREMKFFYNAVPFENSDLVTIFLKGLNEAEGLWEYQTSIQLKLK